MRDVVIVGGGLTGLSAAHALAQHDLDVTLIEVKRHLGGSIQSITREGSILDSGTFAIRDSLDKGWLESLGLEDALFPLAEGVVAFKQGTGQLIDALQQKMTATRLMRMAVSSIGDLPDGRFSICMENGLVFDARALILAVPARYAERMFYGYITPITEALLDYRYDTIQRVSVVCETAQLPATLETPPDMAYPFIHRTTHPARVPEEHTLLQFGIRIDPKRYDSSDHIVDFVQTTYGLPEPVVSHVGYWAESDPMSCYDDDHTQWVSGIRQQLPAGIALVGSDYSTHAPSRLGIDRLDERIQQGIDAAQQVLAALAG